MYRLSRYIKSCKSIYTYIYMHFVREIMYYICADCVHLFLLFAGYHQVDACRCAIEALGFCASPCEPSSSPIPAAKGITHVTMSQL